MSDLHYPDLHIQGFRGIKDISIPELGRVTLITGKNNTGKSSILEALRLHTQNAAPPTIYDILMFREEYRSTDDEERFPRADGAFDIAPLFHGFPRLSQTLKPIIISTNGRTRTMSLTMRVDWLAEEREPDGSRRLVASQKALFEDVDLVPALVVTTEEWEQNRSLEIPHRYRPLGRRLRYKSFDGGRMPGVLVSPYGGEATHSLGPLWDEVALTDGEQEAVEALRIIDPRISAVSMVGGEANARARTAIVRADNIPRPVPLRSFGDGINRLFAIVLSLFTARGGLLLIDEFENGLHYTVQPEVWRVIFRLARDLDVQVFATSHSWDAVESFQRAAADAPDEGALLRLTRRDDDIIPTVFAENELAIATRSRIEVR